MKNKEYERVITLSDLWELFLEHIGIILAAALIVAVGLTFVSRALIAPKYQSRATLYILRQDNEPNYIYTQSDFSLAKDVVNDCTYVLKSQEVLDEVIQRLRLDCSVRQLQKSITTNNPENTRFLEVFVESDSPEDAKRIVDMVCGIASDKIADSMGFDQVNLYAHGTLPEGRSNAIGLVKTALAAVLAAAVVYLLYLIRYLTDTTIQSEESITKYLGISMLAEIPNSQSGKSSGDKYRYRSGKKYQYQSAYRARSGKGGRKSR